MLRSLADPFHTNDLNQNCCDIEYRQNIAKKLETSHRRAIFGLNRTNSLDSIHLREIDQLGISATLTVLRVAIIGNILTTFPWY